MTDSEAVREAREKRLEAELEGTSFVQTPGHRVYGLVRVWYRAGWDAARTFTNEDIERMREAVDDAGFMDVANDFDFEDFMRAALGAVGTVADE